MARTMTLKTGKNSWLAKPQSNHTVHFYPYDDVLLASLVEYFYHGLETGDTCIVIATPEHQTKLNAALRDRGIDLAEAIGTGQFLMYDATETLKGFMNNEQPDFEKFMQLVGRIITLAAGRGKPIRAFGEMVAVLWEQSNLEGLLQLEKYWHGLVEDQPFSLFCAYPASLFDNSRSHREAIQNICSCHSLTLDLSP